MNRILLAFVAMLTIFAFACGGDDGPKASPTSTPRSEEPAETPDSDSDDGGSPTEESDDDESTSSDEDGNIGSLFGSVLGGGLGGATGGGGDPDFAFGADPELGKFLLTDADVPAGYSSFGEFSFKVPDGISETGGGQASMAMFMSGDPSAIASGDVSGMEMLMSMAMKFDDLSDLESSLGECAETSDEDLRDAFNAGGGELPLGVELSDIQLLDTGSLGDDACAISIKMDMSNFFDSMGGFGAGAEGAPEIGIIEMRMYMFAQDDKMGALMRMGFGDGALDAGLDELGLAETMKSRLQGG